MRGARWAGPAASFVHQHAKPWSRLRARTCPREKATDWSHLHMSSEGELIESGSSPTSKITSKTHTCRSKWSKMLLVRAPRKRRERTRPKHRDYPR